MDFSKKILVLDIETERLVSPEKIWCVATCDYNTGRENTFNFSHINKEGLREYLKSYDYLVAHNGLDFDFVVLRDHGLITEEDYQTKTFDTLVTSRLFLYQLPGGHSIANWGAYFKFPKDTFNDFSRYSEELVQRCQIDVQINVKILQRFQKLITQEVWQPSIDLEMQTARYCREMQDNGFYFDYDEAQELHTEIESLVNDLEESLQRDFPPRSVCIREITPTATQSGTLHLKDFRWMRDDGPLDLSAYHSGCPFSVFKFVPFNPRSAKQRIEVLNEAGWQPVEKTKGFEALEKKIQRRAYQEFKTATPEELQRLETYEVYGWKTNEENLATLPPTAPKGAQNLAEFLVLSNRLSTLESWLEVFNPETGRIHGNFNHIGAWTQRKSHSHPNMANIPAVKVDGRGDTIYGRAGGYAVEFRKLWTVPEGRKLVGTDADAIQLRILAHYMEDEDFRLAVTKGTKEQHTDVHSLNQRALKGYARSRDVAKTFIYAWLLGAGNYKVSKILGTTISNAGKAVRSFLASYPGLQALRTKTIPDLCRQGWFPGVDGRKVTCSSSHLMLAGFLQEGESTVMKVAYHLWRQEADQRGIDYLSVNDVHDEWQTEVEEDQADELAEIQQTSITKAGELLGIKCELAGTSNIGSNWYETH